MKPDQEERRCGEDRREWDGEERRRPNGFSVQAPGGFRATLTGGGLLVGFLLGLLLGGGGVAYFWLRALVMVTK